MNSQSLSHMQEEDEELRSIPTAPHQSEEALPDNEREPFNAEHYQLCLKRLLSDDYCAIEASGTPSRTISNLHLLQTAQRRGQRRHHAAPQRIYESADLRYTITNCSLSPSPVRRQTVPTLQSQPERGQQQLFTDPALLSMIRKDISAINRNRNSSLLQ